MKIEHEHQILCGDIYLASSGEPVTQVPSVAFFGYFRTNIGLINYPLTDLFKCLVLSPKNALAFLSKQKNIGQRVPFAHF